MPVFHCVCGSEDFQLELHDIAEKTPFKAIYPPILAVICTECKKQVGSLHDYKPNWTNFSVDIYSIDKKPN